METRTPLQIAIEKFDESGLTYGDHLNNSDIDAWCSFELPDVSGLSRPAQKKAFDDYSFERLRVTTGLKDHCLTSHRMYLENVIGSGYKIVMPADQTELAVHKGMRQISKGLRTATVGVAMVNTAMLTSAEREFNQSVGTRLGNLAQLAGRKKDILSIK